MKCPMCKPRLSYEDMNGNIHKTEEDCAKAQLRIMEGRKVDALIEMLIGRDTVTPFSRYLDYSSPSFSRGQTPYVEDFISLLVKHGYTIYKEY